MSIAIGDLIETKNQPTEPVKKWNEQTKKFEVEGQKPGTSGLRKKVSVFS